MKHKKLHLQSLVAVALCLIFSLAFVGCGDDNDEPEDGKLIVGTWVGTIDDVMDDVEVNLSFQCEFKSDGSFLAKQWLTGTAEPSAYQGIGRWSVSNDNLFLQIRVPYICVRMMYNVHLFNLFSHKTFLAFLQSLHSITLSTF